MGTQLDEAMVAAALGDLAATSPVLDDATVMALTLGDVLTSSDPVVTPELQQQLRVHFSDDQILELGAALAVASGWQRFIEAFGIRPDSWQPGDPTPTRPGV